MKTIEVLAIEAGIDITQYNYVKSGRSLTKARTLELGELNRFAALVRADAWKDAALIDQEISHSDGKVPQVELSDKDISSLWRYMPKHHSIVEFGRSIIAADRALRAKETP